MKSITQKSATALKENRTFSSQNMKVWNGANNRIMTLHDNVIATIEGNNLLLTDSGWQTVTTKERLNGILYTFGLPFQIYQKDFEWYLRNSETGTTATWQGSATFTI